jgi:hypothetical protein
VTKYRVSTITNSRSSKTTQDGTNKINNKRNNKKQIKIDQLRLLTLKHELLKGLYIHNNNNNNNNDKR